MVQCNQPGVDEPFSLKNLSELIQKNSIEALEMGVAEGLALLEQIQKALLISHTATAERKGLQEQADSILGRNTSTRVVVGVVGNTGAGKSSIINALLDEELLVPTSGMRACTASITEISWNTDTGKGKKYRAEIVFITIEEWQSELEVLSKEILQGGRVSSEVRNSETEAGIAFAKIKAVYPTLTDDRIGKSDPDQLSSELLDQIASQGMLGTTLTISHDCVEAFYKSLQKYVDSDDQSNNQQDKKKTTSQPMQVWPLIKVVRIYTKSPVLSTGVVIVDLPGVQDSNAARGAVADSYLQQCAALWVVAPIIRAVNDRAAKKLLGDRFKRQLKYDGTFNGVTFICSKTDDLAANEVLSTLENSENCDAMKETARENEREQKVAKIENEKIQEKIDILDASWYEEKQKVEQFEEFLAQLREGKAVRNPLERSKKRKRTLRSSTRMMRSKLMSMQPYSDDDDYNPSEDDDSDTNLLTEESIIATIQESRVRMRMWAKQAKALHTEYESTEERKELAVRKVESIKSFLHKHCITRRNEFSKVQIQQDFAAGIKELDEETAQEDDEDNFDPEVPIRDYSEVAQSLPIFFVSSRAYQKLRGRSEIDDLPLGFTTLEDTQIPLLRTHCMKMTEVGRFANARQFLSSLHQLLTSLSIWSSDVGDKFALSQQLDFLSERLETFDLDVSSVEATCLRDLKAALGARGLFSSYSYGVHLAEQTASSTVARWSAKVADGGLPWNTYKATCRRFGEHTSSDGVTHNFNHDLGEPIQRQLAPRWEQCFQHRIPDITKSYGNALYECLKLFHNDVANHAAEQGLTLYVLYLLGEQLNNSKVLYQQLGDKIDTAISTQQKECSRSLIPAIASIMTKGYKDCAEQSGKGCFARMKTILANYTAQAQSTMFDEATKKVMQSIGGMYSETERITDGHVTEMIARVRRDYETAFGANISEIKIPKDERKARKAIAELLKGSDAIFQKPLEEIKKEAEKVTIKCEPGCKKEADEVKVKCERGCKNMEDVKMG